MNVLCSMTSSDHLYEKCDTCRTQNIHIVTCHVFDITIIVVFPPSNLVRTFICFNTLHSNSALDTDSGSWFTAVLHFLEDIFTFLCRSMLTEQVHTLLLFLINRHDCKTKSMTQETYLPLPLIAWWSCPHIINSKCNQPNKHDMQHLLDEDMLVLQLEKKQQNLTISQTSFNRFDRNHSLSITGSTNWCSPYSTAFAVKC